MSTAGSPFASRVFVVRGAALLAMSLVLGVGGCSTTKRQETLAVSLPEKDAPARASRLTVSALHAVEMGNLERARNLLQRAVAIDPDYGPAYSNLGLVAYQQERFYEAVEAFEIAVELLPGDARAIYNLAVALEAGGQVEDALGLYAQAVEIDGADPMYLGNLVRLRIRLGDHDESLQQQLRDLALIENRPQWRRWADVQLGLYQNDLLDRGPAVPDFNATVGGQSSGEAGLSQEAFDLESRIIDLTLQPVPSELPSKNDGAGFLRKGRVPSVAQASGAVAEPSQRRTRSEQPVQQASAESEFAELLLSTD